MKRLILALILATTGALAQSVDDVAAGGGGGSGTIGTGAVNDIVCYTDATTVGPCDTAGFIWNASKLTVSGSGTGVIGMLEGTAPGAGSTSGEHNIYFDSSDGRLYTHNNGGSALPIGYVLTHATDCTSVTVQGTGVNLKEGDICHESDADALYSYDGSAWDAVGGGSTPEITVLYHDAGSMSSSGDVTVTGTSTSTGATNLVSIAIPANTFQVDDVMYVETEWSKSGTNGSWRVEVMWINNSNWLHAGISPVAGTLNVYQWAAVSFEAASSQVIHGTQTNGNTTTQNNFKTLTADETGSITMAFRVVSVNASDTVTLERFTVKRLRNQ